MNSRAPNHYQRPGNHLPYHAWPGRRILLLAAPAIVAVLVLALALNVLTARAFGDLEVTFSSPPSPSPFRAGTTHSFAVEVTNNGASGQPDAEAVVFEYRAPAGVVIQSISSSVGPCEVGTEGDPSDPSICNLGNMPTGRTDTVNVTVYVLPDVPHGTLLDHDVRAWQFGTEDDPPDNENHAFVTVQAEADLSVSKTSEGDVATGFDTNTFQDILTPTADQVTAGELIKYIITVTNTGPSDAQTVIVTDTLPAKFDFVESVPAGCWANAANPLLITCPLNTVPATTTQQIEVVARTRPDAAIDDPDDGDNVRTATNNVQVSSDTTDPTTPNSFDLAATVNAVANLQITKTDIPDPVLAGEEVTYDITARNLGPSKARATDITDTLPSGLVFVRCEPVDPDEVPVCTYDQPANTVTLTDFRINGLLRDDLMPDEERSFRIVAYARSNLVKEPDIYGEPDAVGNLVTITDTVVITEATDISDFYAANNTDHELTGVTSQADLAVSKTDVPNPTPDDGYLTFDPVTNSFVYTYYLTIENLGPSDAGRVILTDTLPVYASLDMVGSDPLTAITTTGSPTGALGIRFRDDGVVIVDWGQIAGNDGRRDDLDLTNPANPSLPTTRTLTIRVRVDANVAPDIGFVENRVEVGTVPGNICPTQTGSLACTDPWPHGYTPTPDSNLSNNVFVEQTLLVTPAVKVDKKVYVRSSPARGIDVTTDGLTEAERCAAYSADDILTLPGDELTYCYNITNEGDTWLHSITLQDPSDAAIYRAATTNFTVVDPSQPPLRGTITVAGADEAQTITIATTEPEVAVLAPKGTPDDYDHILIIRSFTVDFPAGNNQIIALGTNRARVDAVPSTKYSTPLPGIEPSGDDYCNDLDPSLICDTDLLHDTLALPVLEDTTKEWRIFDDHDGDGEPTAGDIVEYTVNISNTGAISATGVVFYDGLYNYINDDPDHPWVPAKLINGSVTAAIHVSGRDPVTGRIIDADVQPPDLAFGDDLLLRTQAPAIGGAWIEITDPSAIVLPGEITLGNNTGDDEVRVATRLAIPPKGELLRFNGVTYDPPIPVTFSLRVRYQVRIKDMEAGPGFSVHCGKTIVLNHGWVDYNEIDLFDQRFPQFDPTDTNKYFTSNRQANNHAGTAGLVYWWSETPGWPEIPAGVEPTNFVQGPHFDGPRFDDEYPRDDDDPTWFEVSRQAPCKGVDWRLQLPAINTDECETWIQVQNVGNEFTKALLVLWGEPGWCPPQAAGPLKIECTGLLRPGSAWTFTNRLLPAGARSGIMYSLNATDLVTDERGNERIFADMACGRLFPLIRQNHDEWLLFDRAYRESGTYFGPIGDFPGEQLVLDFGAHTGEPLAVTVNRTCPDVVDPNLDSSAAYVGISTDREGFRDPRAGGFAYYAPLVWADYFGMNSIIHVQNSGEECTSVELWFQRQGDCIRPVVWDILSLAPGESYPFDPNEVVGPGWQGSAWLSASQPLGVIVDTLGANHFGAYHGVPADVFVGQDDPLNFSLGTQVNYAPLIYREHQGWETSIQVQNLSSTYNAKVKVYFLDNSGDVIKTVVDWICPRGSQTFFLPMIAGLPGNWVGSARVESQNWFSPGDPAISAPRVLSVVMLEKYTDPAKTSRQEAVLYNALQEMGSYDWQLGPGRGGFRGTGVLSVPLAAKRNRGVSTELAIQNLNPHPGFTDFVIFIYDQNRLIDFVCEKLNEKQVEYINLDEWGIIPPGFLGSLVISATYTNQQGGDPTQEGVGVALGAVAVERVGRVLSDPDIPGDESKAFEAFPLFDGGFLVEVGPDGLPPACPGQP